MSDIKIEDLKVGMSIHRLNGALEVVSDIDSDNSFKVDGDNTWYYCDDEDDYDYHVDKHFKSDADIIFEIRVPRESIPEWATCVTLDESGLRFWEQEPSLKRGEYDLNAGNRDKYEIPAQMISIKTKPLSVEQMAEKFKRGECTLEEFTTFVKEQ